MQCCHIFPLEIIIQIITQSFSNRFLAAAQITVHICKTVFGSNNSRKMNNFVFQSVIIAVETKNLDSSTYEM